MRTPVITKQQTIAALVELKRQDLKAKVDKWQEENDILHLHAHQAIKDCLLDPVRMQKLMDHMDSDGDPAVEIDVAGGSASVCIFEADDEVRKVVEAYDDHQEKHPGRLDEVRLTRLLEDKLTGCDPKSLLTVPENVETLRNLANGLQLMPLTPEELELLNL